MSYASTFSKRYLHPLSLVPCRFCDIIMGLTNYLINRMPWFRLVFLITVLAMTSGYRFRCYLACVDQTGTQNDYVEQRDNCREYAQLKVDMVMREAGGAMDEKAHKATLVTLFSQCMCSNGWNVPDGKGEGCGGGKKPEVAAPAAVAVPSAAVVAAAKAEDKANIIRAAECAFARHSAKTSRIAADRAEACDFECAEGLRLAPNSPRPAACPPDISPKLSKGNEQ